MEWYYRHGYVCLDWFGSIDHENAYWCIPELVSIGRWERLDTDDSSKLIEYVKKRFDLPKGETGFIVARPNDKTIVCRSDKFSCEIRLIHAQAFALLVSSPGTPFENKYKLFLYKNEKGECVVHARHLTRKDGKVVGYPVLIVLPKTTVIKQNNPLCCCGVAMVDHAEAESDGWKCNYGKQLLIKTITDDTPLKEIIELTSREKRICIFNRGFYGDQRDAYRTLAKMLRELPFLILRGSLSKDKCFCLGMREAGQIAPSGLKGMKGDYETQTKRELQTYIREARHLRTVLCLDFQRSSDIAKSIASQRDFLFVKRSTKDLIPDDYLWLYDAIENEKSDAYENLEWDKFENLPTIPTLKPWESYILFPDHHFEKRFHGMAAFHHKKPQDSWANDANCTIEYLDKHELEKVTEEVKIKQLTKKKEARQERLQGLKQAKAMKDEGLTYQEIAIKLGWLGRDGKPSGSALQRAMDRALKSGII
jgi:hypothetical protein